MTMFQYLLDLSKTQWHCTIYYYMYISLFSTNLHWMYNSIWYFWNNSAGNKGIPFTRCHHKWK